MLLFKRRKNFCAKINFDPEIKRRRLRICVDILLFKKELKQRKKKHDIRRKALLQSALFRAEFEKQLMKRMRKIQLEELKKKSKQSSKNKGTSIKEKPDQILDSRSTFLQSLGLCAF